MEEMIRLAFLKYKLSGKKSMNTYIFSQVSKRKMEDSEIDKLISVLEIKIKKFEREKKEKAIEKVAFTCNIYTSIIKKGDRKK